MGSLDRQRFRCGDGPRGAGFTLIELLLVLLIMSLMVSLASMSFAGMERMGLDSEANRLQRTLRALQHEALLRRSPTGLLLDEAGYRAMVWNQLSRAWSELDGRHFRPRDLTARGASLTLLPVAGDQQGRVHALGGESPQVILPGAGIGHPYLLRLTSLQHSDLLVTLAGDGSGQVVRR